MTRQCRTCGRLYQGDERFCTVDGTPLISPAEPKRPAIAEDPLLGKLVGHRYRIARRLGEGGTSVVYLANQEAVGSKVAIKFLKPEIANRVGSVERFIVEARASSRVDHPNIVSVIDFGRDPDGRYYLVMEYIAGRSLIRMIKESRGFVQERVIGIVRQLLSAVGAAHREGIVHRDLKPENVICTTLRGTQDFVKVLDFGLAKFVDGRSGGQRRVTRHDVILGTPYYMSPEQARCDLVDARTDLYSIGVMTYEMLTGVVPFRAGDAVTVLNHHLLTTPTPPSTRRPDARIHPELEHLVLALLAKNPAHRYQTAEATLIALDRVSARLQLEATSSARLGDTLTLRGPGGGDDRVSTPPAQHRPTATTIWEVPGLLEDSGRLVKLWDERLGQVADLVWGPGGWPSEVVETTRAVREIEASVERLEAEMAPLHAQIEGLEKESREAEATLRFQRLDLVARQCVLREALGGALNVTELEHLVDKTAKLGMFDEGEWAARPLDPQTLCDELDRKIDELDRRTRRQVKRTRQAVMERQQQIQAKVNEVRALRGRQVPLCSDLVGRLNAAAAGRAELAERITGVAEVAGAIQIYQNMLASVRVEAPQDES